MQIFRLKFKYYFKYLFFNFIYESCYFIISILMLEFEYQSFMQWLGGTQMNKKSNLLSIPFFFASSILLTLFLFYVMSWYSFNTLPTSVVFYRMIFSTVVLTISMFLISTFLKMRKIWYTCSELLLQSWCDHQLISLRFKLH